MTTNKKQKPDPQIIKILQSDDSLLIIQTIEELRDTGNISYIPTLIEMLHSSNDQLVNSKVINLLSDIKKSEIIPLLLDAIQNKRYAEQRQNLISICWNNGLDFSKHLPFFIDIVIAEEFETAFEAYTVIVNTEGKISPEIMNQEIDKIEAILSQTDEQKKQLLIDIIDFLPEISE